MLRFSLTKAWEIFLALEVKTFYKILVFVKSVQHIVDGTFYLMVNEYDRTASTMGCRLLQTDTSFIGTYCVYSNKMCLFCLNS